MRTTVLEALFAGLPEHWCQGCSRPMGRTLRFAAATAYLVLQLSLRMLCSSQLQLQLRKLCLSCSASHCLVGLSSIVWPRVLPALCDAGCSLLLRPGGAGSGVPRASKWSAAAASCALRGAPAISPVGYLPCSLLVLIWPCSRDQGSCAGRNALILMAAGHAQGSAAGDWDTPEGWQHLDSIYEAEGFADTESCNTHRGALLYGCWLT